VEVRAAFQSICEQHSIVKKTLAGPELWEVAKTQLIQGHPWLDQAFRLAVEPQAEQMRLSLDVICMDVTKRMRIVEHQMTLADAKNMLNINPEEGRQLRQALIGILTAHNFINKHESSNWDELKQLWMVQSGLDQHIPPVGSSNREKCLRAVQIICRDIMKRWRDAQVAKSKANNKAADGKGQRSAEAGLSIMQQPLPFLQQPVLEEAVGGAPAVSHQQPSDPPSHQALHQALRQTPQQVSHQASRQTANQTDMADDYGFQIDPSLLATARGYPTISHNAVAYM